MRDRLIAGEPAAIARAISLVDANHPGGISLLESLEHNASRTPVIGFTGAPGVGKSTLINAYTAWCRAQKRKVAILSVDPSSPISGGAILGDRLRMSEHTTDAGVYIRSLASRGHLGGLCSNISDVIRVVDAASFDVIVLETVGTGQAEVEVTRIADVKVVLNAPGMGDAIQAMKSGILEIADILVVNKADKPQAAQTTLELRSMLHLRPESLAQVAVIETIATQAIGIEELSNAIDACMSEVIEG